MVGDYRNNFLTNYFNCLILKMFLGKLTVTVSVKKFPVFYGTEVSLSCSDCLGTDPHRRHLNNFTSSHLVCVRYILILSCYLFFGLLDCPFTFSARNCENLGFKIRNNPGEKYQYIMKISIHHFLKSHTTAENICVTIVCV